MFAESDALSVLDVMEIKETIEEAYHLKPKETRAFILDSYGYSTTEIQDAMGVTERTVYRYIRTATNLLRNLWFSSY